MTTTLPPPVNPGVIPDVYVPPWGTPLPWGSEQSGQLRHSVVAYWHGIATPTEMAVVIAYVRYVLEAPCWRPAGHDLHALRDRAARAVTAQDLHAVISDCLEIGIDPL